MTSLDEASVDAIPLTSSQRNIYNGVLQDDDPALYLVGRSYQFHPLAPRQFLAALHATIMKHPIQLCVLSPSGIAGDYPVLVPRLSVDDIVTVRNGSPAAGSGANDLQRLWVYGIADTPLVRYIVRTDLGGQVCGLDAFTHHILLDGGATGLIETDLGDYLSARFPPEIPCIRDGLTKIAAAHQREASKVAEAHERLTETVRRELAEDARSGGYGQNSSDMPGTASRGVRGETVRISGRAYDELVALGEAEHIPLNVLVTAAAAAVDASIRQSTVSLLIHAADNRFGEPGLDVATCLVNSVAQPSRFAPFASVEEVVRTLDRGYVLAVRRKWLREEHYRRLHIATNRTTHVEALTLNFLSESCAPALRPHLTDTPVTTAIGPVESMAVACVVDDERGCLEIAIWNRADLPEQGAGVAARIASTLEAIPAMWHQPMALAVDDWLEIGPDGALRQADSMIRPAQPAPPAWFLDAGGEVAPRVRRREYIDRWVAWLVTNGIAAGDIAVFTDDDTDKTVDLMIACHLAGCAYSACDTGEELHVRAESLAQHGNSVSVHVIDVAAAHLPTDWIPGVASLVDRRVREVAADPGLADMPAYIMPTSGSTGQPKLVEVSHGSLAVFCAAVRTAYGWRADDTILQCAPLTSDISVEEIFGAAHCGARLVRSTAVKTGDLQALADDLVARQATVVDLPTAIWHLLCDDAEALASLRGSRLRQVIVGGEAIRSTAVDRWVDAIGSQQISLISTYGPTETTVVATYLPIVSAGVVVGEDTRSRLGRPMVPDTVFTAFGEVVIVGDLVASGYLETDNPSFGWVADGRGPRRRAFATADRTVADPGGFPVLAGRRDAIVKIGGRRVDTAEIAKLVSAESGVADVAVEQCDGCLAIWFQTRSGNDEAVVVARIRSMLTTLRVPSFVVTAVPIIPRKAGGKVDSAKLPAPTQVTEAPPGDHSTDPRAVALAQMWSRQLGRTIRPDSSLLDEGIGSLDLIRILPDTRRHLARHLSILDLISTDSAQNLVDDAGPGFGWLDSATAAAIENDLADLPQSRTRDARHPVERGSRPIVVLGGSGILGTGFAEAILSAKQAGRLPADVVIVTRSSLPEGDPWSSLRNMAGVRIEVVPTGFGRAELERVLDETDPGSVLNCIGNTNVLVPYRDLRTANVELVAAAVRACARRGSRFVHLSTFVVTGDVTAPHVIDPREAPYPYAASKAVAELIVARSPAELDFTIVRLPRVLGQPEQLAGSADILTAVADACGALCAYPAITLTEDVTTANAAGAAILGLLPGAGGPAELGCGITVLRGQAVPYAEFLSDYGRDELSATSWKELLDQSDWAKRNPKRWSVIDAWITLGLRIGERTYAEFLADYPTISLDLTSITEVQTTPQPLRELLTAEFAYRMATHTLTSEEWQ
ncbi:AMP-binding protein [Mycolicibacterium sphagni]|uniref:AMP-binding protein n=1 Tax=Mycolicibacterium sphagni TaxID=1786 RepID=UPI0021F38B91|nr:AMP-binding protein [Mycolicibacterium sphagni]MCV7174603.1 AMP-binding protein [Mycolicibacterium sphagni]